jgi:hypothetical protein
MSCQVCAQDFPFAVAVQRGLKLQQHIHNLRRSVESMDHEQCESPPSDTHLEKYEGKRRIGRDFLKSMCLWQVAGPVPAHC